MSKIAVITGASAGVGRATAREFAKHGYDVALIARDPDRLAEAVAELERMGVRALACPADVADEAAVRAAAETVERELGPIDVWVNNAMATVFCAVRELPPEELRRATEVTYFGTVHGTMAALHHMTPRNRGTIVNIGSALAYRSVPLQAAYCGAKSAIRGFTDSLRSELLHDRLDIRLTMVHLPAVNTPQFGWAKNHTGHGARPVPPVFEPEVPARAVYYAAHADRREVWVGFPTVKAILANRIAPRFADWYLAKTGYKAQMTDAAKPADAPSNLFEPVPGTQAARGTFGNEARTRSWEVFATEHRPWIAAGAALLLYGVHRLAARRGI